MRRVSLLFIVLMIVFYSHGDAVAGVSDAAVLFLRIAAGARAAGMGEAFVAVADDASATHWNPAGLGSYPLASEFHEFRVTDDKTMRAKASKVLKGDVNDDYSETIGQFLFRKDGIVHVSEAGEETYIEYEVDPDVSMVQYIAANAVLDDRELLKTGVRTIALENTGVSFGQIDSQRRRLLDHLDNNQIDEINSLFETIITDWQNLKIVPESVTFLQERLDFVLQDNQLTPEEYSQVVETLTNATRKSRPLVIKVPYTVLLSLWKDYALPWETTINKIVLLRNDVPEDNYKQFDVWALTPSGIIRWDGVNAWESSMEIYPRKGDKLQGVVAAYTGETDEERLLLLKDRVASYNYKITKKQIEDIIAEIMMSFSDEVSPSEMLTADLENLIVWFEEMTLDPLRLSSFLDLYNKVTADGVIAANELEQLEFSLHAANTDRLPVTVHLPYSLPFISKPTCIEATEKLLWVGTDDGLYLFNGRAWQRYTTEDQLPSNKINWLSVFDKNRLWIATGNGVLSHYKGQWTTFGIESGLEQIEYTAVYGYSRDRAWAAADNRLFSYNGTAWTSDYTYSAVVNDTLSRIVREFTGLHDSEYIQQAVNEIKAKNGLDTDYPQAGTQILIPYEYAFRHPITAMLFDNRTKNLWVGTTHGLKIFADGRFKVFGYKPYTAARTMSIEEAVRDFDEEAGSGKIEQLTALIKSYNYIEDDKIFADQTVYVYSNPLGSHIYTMESVGDNIFVGTNFGTVRYGSERFSRYYHNNLEREKTVSILSEGGDTWFATTRKVVIYASAWNEVTVMHAKWLPELAPDLYYEYVSYVQQLGEEWGTIGVSAKLLSYGEIARTTEFSSTPIDTFHSFDGALALTYGASVSPDLSIGVTAKIIYSRLAEQGAGAELGEGNATAFAVEAGLLYRTPIEKLTLGAALTNLGPNIAYIDAAQSDPLPRNLAVGLAYDLFKNPYNKLTLVGEVNKMLTDLNDGFSEEMKEAIENVGIEYWYGSFIALRAGYVNDDVGQVNTPTVGLGLQYKRIRFDFAYIPSQKTVPLANTLRNSATYRW